MKKTTLTKKITAITLVLMLLVGLVPTVALPVAAEFAIPEGAVELTDENADAFVWTGVPATYDPAVGWTGNEGNYFQLELSAGDTVYYELSGEPGQVSLLEIGGAFSVDDNSNSLYGSLTVDTDAYYSFTTQNNVTVRAYLVEAGSGSVPESTPEVIYLDIAGSGIEDGWVAIHLYDTNRSYVTDGSSLMTLVEGTVYSYIVPEDAVTVLFSNGPGSIMSEELTIPTDGTNLYTFTTGEWSTYVPSVPEPELTVPEVIYLDIEGSGIADGWVAIHLYDTNGSYVTDGSVLMTLVEGTVYSYTVPENAVTVFFSDGPGSIMSEKLTIPTDGTNLYTFTTGEWSTYVPSEPETEPVAWNDTDDDGVIDDGETTYTDLEAALLAGGEVKLAKDVDITTDIPLSDITVTLDLNGYKITFSYTCLITMGANAYLTVLDSSAENTGAITPSGSTAEDVFIVDGDSAVLSLYSGTFTAGVYDVVYVKNGALNVYGGTYITNGSAAGLCEVNNSSTVLIYGGSFDIDPSVYVADGYEATYNESTGYYDVAEASGSEPEGGSVPEVIYLDIAGSGIEDGEACIHFFDASWDYVTDGSVLMTLVEGTVYSYTVPEDAVTVSFSNASGGIRSERITIPTDGTDLYTFTTGEWSTYVPSEPELTVPEVIYLDIEGTDADPEVIAIHFYDAVGRYLSSDTMDLVEGTIRSCNVPDGTEIVYFAHLSGPSYTEYLVLPTNGTNLYTLATGEWSVYVAPEPEPEPTGKIVIEMADTYGDGWNGANITVYKNGELIAEATVADGYDNVLELDYDSEAEYEIFWVSGRYDYECSYTIFVNGEEYTEELLPDPYICCLTGISFNSESPAYNPSSEEFVVTDETPLVITVTGYGLSNIDFGSDHRDKPNVWLVTDVDDYAAGTIGTYEIVENTVVITITATELEEFLSSSSVSEITQVAYTNEESPTYDGSVVVRAELKKHTVSTVGIENGEFYIINSNADAGEEVILHFDSDEGYYFDLTTLSVTDENGEPIEVTRYYTSIGFIMPDSDVTVSCSSKELVPLEVTVSKNGEELPLDGTGTVDIGDCECQKSSHK